MKDYRLLLLLASALLVATLTQCRQEPEAISGDSISGYVYHDVNGNGQYDVRKDKPLKGVAVSNGTDVVVTSRNGFYQLPRNNGPAVFVIKPRNYSFLTDEYNRPQFYRMNLPHGASGTRFPGLEPTETLDSMINFPLVKKTEPEEFRALIFGDTQPRNDREIHYIQQDIISELVGTEAAFGVTLGDIVYDNLDLYNHLAGSIAAIGIPWIYVHGNHDNDYTGDSNTDALGPWYNNFGPDYYSFTYGPAHFVVLNNIRWLVTDSTRFYRTGLGTEQLTFLENEVNRIDKDQLLVLMTHIPWSRSTSWADPAEKKRLMDILASHPNSITLAAHTHLHYHHLMGTDDGYKGEGNHHLVSMGTTCGGWWSGAPDEFGIPHSTMADGTPTSYGWLHVEGTRWKLEWKAARRAPEFQMSITAPESFSLKSDTSLVVTANIFNALPGAVVRVRIGKEGEWIDMPNSIQTDPARVAVTERERELGMIPWRRLPSPELTPHIWSAEIPLKNLSPGVFTIEVDATDKWYDYNGTRLIYIKE
ncbi:MAG: calcineurin-like phosphoesterase family protein [Bacteroidales bacterium]|nr:calcineurin-like phosphoesterase family protein [Bacteroidales bacterium]